MWDIERLGRLGLWGGRLKRTKPSVARHAHRRRIFFTMVDYNMDCVTKHKNQIKILEAVLCTVHLAIYLAEIPGRLSVYLTSRIKR